MNYNVQTLEDGRIQLDIGNVGVAFSKDVDIDTLVGGVNILVEKILGVSPFELTMAVIGELNKADAAKENNTTEHESSAAGSEEVQRETGSHQEAGTAERRSSSDGEEGISQEG